MDRRAEGGDLRLDARAHGEALRLVDQIADFDQVFVFLNSCVRTFCRVPKRVRTCTSHPVRSFPRVEADILPARIKTLLSSCIRRSSPPTLTILHDTTPTPAYVRSHPQSPSLSTAPSRVILGSPHFDNLPSKLLLSSSIHHQTIHCRTRAGRTLDRLHSDSSPQSRRLRRHPRRQSHTLSFGSVQAFEPISASDAL